MLIFCEDGQNKSLCIIVCYLMQKYKWGFVKSLHFINNKRKNLEIKKNFFKPLQKIANEFEKVNKVSHNFLDEFYSDFPEDEILLRNTFLNSSDIFFEKDFHKYHNILYKKNKLNKNLKKIKNERLSITKNSKIKKTTKSLGRGRRKKYKKKIQWADQKKKSKSVKKNYNKNKLLTTNNKKNNLNDLHKKNKEDILKSMKFYNLKKLENFLKTNIKTNEKKKNNIDNLCVSSSIEFYKNNLKNLQRKIFSKTKDRNKKRIKTNKSSSKVSTNIIEENSTTDLLQNSKNNINKKDVFINFQKKNFLSNFKKRKVYNNFFKKNNKKCFSNKKKYLRDISKNLNISQKSNSRKYQSLERRISKSKQQNIKDTFSKILKINKKKKDFGFNQKLVLNKNNKKEKEKNKKKILKKDINDLKIRFKRPCSAGPKEKIRKSNKVLLEKKKLFSNYKNLFENDIFRKSKKNNKDNYRGYPISKKILKI